MRYKIISKKWGHNYMGKTFATRENAKRYLKNVVVGGGYEKSTKGSAIVPVKHRKSTTSTFGFGGFGGGYPTLGKFRSFM